MSNFKGGILLGRIKHKFIYWHRTASNICMIDQSHVTTAVWWPLVVAVVSVTCMRVRWVLHTLKYTQWKIFLFESSHKSPYWTNPYHVGFRYEASSNFHTYFGQCPNDTFILFHIPLHVCPNYPHTGITTVTAPGGHHMAVVTWDRSIISLSLPCCMRYRIILDRNVSRVGCIC